MKKVNLPDCISVEEFDNISNHGIIPNGYFLCTECYLYISKEIICPSCEEVRFRTKNKSFNELIVQHGINKTPKTIINHYVDLDEPLSVNGEYRIKVNRTYTSLSFNIPKNIPKSLAIDLVRVLNIHYKNVDSREIEKFHQKMKEYLYPHLKELAKTDREKNQEKYINLYHGMRNKINYLFDPKFHFRLENTKNKYTCKNNDTNFQVRCNKHLFNLIEKVCKERKCTKAQLTRDILYDYFQTKGYIDDSIK